MCAKPIADWPVRQDFKQPQDWARLMSGCLARCVGGASVAHRNSLAIGRLAKITSYEAGVDDEAFEHEGVGCS